MFGRPTHRNPGLYRDASVVEIVTPDRIYEYRRGVRLLDGLDCRGGGTVDAGASKALAFRGVRVRFPPPVLQVNFQACPDGNRGSSPREA